jgi:hypothetical protein
MFAWYKQAQGCYVYLKDVRKPDELAGSTWFTRGWTLQELLAPESVYFYNKDWKEIGSKQDMTYDLTLITSITTRAFQAGVSFEAFSVAERMSWMAGRQTTRAEDIAYCLLGIFGINMPLLYGEGGHRAFRRLQEHIVESIEDLTIFAWHERANLPRFDWSVPIDQLDGYVTADDISDDELGGVHDWTRNDWVPDPLEPIPKFLLEDAPSFIDELPKDVPSFIDEPLFSPPALGIGNMAEHSSEHANPPPASDYKDTAESSSEDKGLVCSKAPALGSDSASVLADADSSMDNEEPEKAPISPQSSERRLCGNESLTESRDLPAYLRDGSQYSNIRPTLRDLGEILDPHHGPRKVVPKTAMLVRCPFLASGPEQFAPPSGKSWRFGDLKPVPSYDPWWSQSPLHQTDPPSVTSRGIRMTLPIVKQTPQLYLILLTHLYSTYTDDLSEFWLCARVEEPGGDGVFHSRVFRSSERLFVKKLSNLATPRMTTIFAARDVKAHESLVLPSGRLEKVDDVDMQDLQARLDSLRR